MENKPLSLSINIHEAKEILKDPENVFILDVRDSEEFQYCHLTAAINIPTGKIDDYWKQLPTNKLILVYCHHGMRSLAVTKNLREYGLKNAVSLSGGIDQWSREIDPQVPRY